MSLWQRALIGLARCKSVTDFMQGNRFTQRMASRFVAGDCVQAALRIAAALHERGIAASLYYLGEYVEAPAAIEANVAQILEAITQLGDSSLDVHVSIDSTQIGFAHTDALGVANALRIGQRLAQQPPAGRRRLLMLDMEDFSVVQKTLDLRARLAQAGCPAGITIQAYLHRSERDLHELVAGGVSAIRLVKGAFAERADRAWTASAEIGREYLRLARYLLSEDAAARGVYPVFATHDETTVEAVAAIAEQNRRTPEDYEFEMLYGIRTPLQQRIVAVSRCLRLYVPFGTQWWPYTVRRIGENPSNARAVLNALRPAAEPYGTPHAT